MKRLPTEAEIARLEFLGVGDIAAELGMRRGSFSMALHRARLGESGGIDFPPPHFNGPCSLWIRTEEVQQAIDGSRR